MSNRTIAIVSDAIYPYNKGGKETRIHQLSTRMAKNGWDVHIYTMKWWTGADTITESGRTLHAIAPLMPLYSKGRRSIRQGILFGLFCWRLVNIKCDVIEVDSMPYFPIYTLWLISKIKHIPLVVQWHEVWSKKYWLTYLGYPGLLGYTLEKFASKLPDYIIAGHQITFNSIRNIYGRTNNVVTIESGVDTESINRIPASKEKNSILYAGRLLSHKNIHLLIHSFNKLLNENPKLRLGIIGDGPEMKNLRNYASKLKILESITFYGFKKNISEVYSLMKSSKVFVLPSTREGFGITVIEANACGIPVVTIKSPNNAAQFLVKNGENGYITHLSPSALASTIQKALEISDTLKLKCYSVSNLYNWNKALIKVEKFYEKI